MEREKLEKLRDDFRELADLINEILTIDTYEQTEENIKLVEQKVAMFVYKMMRISNALEKEN